MAVRNLVLWCPDWPIVAARAEGTTDQGPGSPLAISHKGVITHCSREARACGVRIGQRLRDAQATATELDVVTQDDQRDQRVWDRVLQALRDTVARIAVFEPGTLALRAPGLARYYGSEVQAAQAILDVVTALDCVPSARIGIADSLWSAIQAARYARATDQAISTVEPGGDGDFLAPLPLRVLDSPDLVATLSALGLSTLADFAALDADQVAQRFGPEGSFLHACARGQDPRQALSIDIPPSTDRHWRSDTALSRADELSFALRGTVEDFVAGLTAQHLVCTTVLITLVDDRGRSHPQLWSHPRFFQPADLVNRVRWQWQALARYDAEDYQEGGVVEVTFQARSPDALLGHEPGLWGGARDNSRVEHTIAHLQSRLGHHAVSRATLTPGHDFDEREILVPWGTARDHASTDPHIPTETVSSFVAEIPRPLPATVFHPPAPVTLTDHSGALLAIEADGASVAGEPALLHSQHNTREVVAWAGPWPIIERWWDQDASRRRYRLQLLDREGVGWLVSHDPARGSWYVEARYD